MELLKNLIHYLPYILLFAVATMLIYGWGLWRSMHQNQDLNNLLTSKGISRIKKELKRNGKMTKKELSDCVKDLTPASHLVNSESESLIQISFWIRCCLIWNDRK